MNYRYILFESSGLSRYTNKGNIITVYRGIKNKYDKDFKREKAGYCSCYSFWSPIKSYAQSYGDFISERQIDVTKFFDLDADDISEFEKVCGYDFVGGERDLTFAAWLCINGYDGYTRVEEDQYFEDDDPESFVYKQNHNQEYVDNEFVIIDKDDEELKQEIDKLSKKDPLTADGTIHSKPGKEPYEVIITYNGKEIVANDSSDVYEVMEELGIEEQDGGYDGDWDSPTYYDIIRNMINKAVFSDKYF